MVPDHALAAHPRHFGGSPVLEGSYHRSRRRPPRNRRASAAPRPRIASCRAPKTSASGAVGDSTGCRAAAPQAAGFLGPLVFSVRTTVRSLASFPGSPRPSPARARATIRTAAVIRPRALETFGTGFVRRLYGCWQVRRSQLRVSCGSDSEGGAVAVHSCETPHCSFMRRPGGAQAAPL